MKNSPKYICITIAFTVFLMPLISVAGIDEKDVLKKLDFIRSIKVTSDQEKLKNYNKQLDETWKYLEKNKTETLPILNKQLSLEADKSRPSHFLLLDTGFFLMLSGEPVYQKTAKKAFYKINPHDEVVSANFQQLFNFAYQVSMTGDPAILAYLDRAFLSRKDAFVFVPQHAMQLERGLINVFLYGAYGPASEQHLQKLLQDNLKKNPELSRYIVELLIWIGTDKTVPQVKQLMEIHNDYETFARCVAYFMQVGGKQGQQIMQNVDAKKLDTKAAEYYQQIKNDIGRQSFASYKNMMTGMPGEQKLKNSIVKSRLAAMYDNYGKDTETSPFAILNSDLPKEYLIEQLVKIRSRMLYRLSDEALDDVKITNVLLNALRYRDK